MASYEAIFWGLPEAVPMASRRRLASLAWDTLPLSWAFYECVDWCLTAPEAHAEAIGLLDELHGLGIELAVRRSKGGDDLAARDPQKALTPELRTRIEACRDDLITLLRFGPVTVLTPAEFARSASLARFHTKDGPVILAADNADPTHLLLAFPEEATVYHVHDLPSLPGVQSLWPNACGTNAGGIIQ